MKKSTRSKSTKNNKLPSQSIDSGSKAPGGSLSTGSGVKKASRSSSAGQSSGADKKFVAESSPDLYLFDSKTLAQLSVGSAVVIATLLSVPDAVALIPGATSIISWALRLIGNWVIGAVLWFVGFGALVQLLRLVSRGVWAGASGLKLSRFDRLIQWSDIQSISLEPNAFFTRIFSLKVPARRLTVYFRFTAKNKILANVLFPNFIPSFFFTKETFDALVRTIFDRSQILPSAQLPLNLDHDYAVFAFRPEQITIVKNTSNWLNKQRLIVTAVIAISLIVFLGRKAIVYYAYNSALKEYSRGQFEKADRSFKLSTDFDYTFAAGWNGRAQTEFHLAEMKLTSFDQARIFWHRALLCKPDYVEPRLGLARLDFYKRDFVSAADNITRAAFFAPQNTLVMLEQAEFDVRYGRPAQGLKEARLLVSQAQASAEYVFMAHCLIAQAKLDQGDVAGAALEMSTYSNQAADFVSGENVTYMYIVKSRIATAQKNFVAAENFAQAALRRQPHDLEALVQAAQAFTDRGNAQRADLYLKQARSLGVADPWINIVQAHNLLAQNLVGEAIVAYADALKIPDGRQDAIALATIKKDLTSLAADSANAGAAPYINQLVQTADKTKP